MECGVEDKLLSVEEPETCVYEMRLTTPALCNPQADPVGMDDSAGGGGHVEL